MSQKEAVEQRLAEINKLQAYLSPYKGLPYEEFCKLPKNFGAAARFIQLIAKYTVEISQLIGQKHDIEDLSDYYLEKTLGQKKVIDVYKMVNGIDGLIESYSKHINKLLRKK